MEQRIETRVPASKVWEAWERAHAMHGQGEIEPGVKGTTTGKKRLKYQVLEVVPGKSFSILWKAMFVRLVFSHAVQPIPRGSEIRYGFSIEGPFAWPIRWLLSKKIASNLFCVLNAFVKKLEEMHR